jgi:hypothetical protein
MVRMLKMVLIKQHGVKKTGKSAELRAQKETRDAPKITALQEQWQRLKTMVNVLSYDSDRQDGSGN